MSGDALQGPDRHLFPDNDDGAHETDPGCFCGPAWFPVIGHDGRPVTVYLHGRTP